MRTDSEREATLVRILTMLGAACHIHRNTLVLRTPHRKWRWSGEHAWLYRPRPKSSVVHTYSLCVSVDHISATTSSYLSTAVARNACFRTAGQAKRSVCMSCRLLAKIDDTHVASRHRIGRKRLSFHTKAQGRTEQSVKLSPQMFVLEHFASSCKVEEHTTANGN